nr:zinc finger protein 233-like [Parasteatoda tepidariorum]
MFPNLKKPLKGHRKEKSHVCNICFKSFSTKYNLAAHMRVHSGEKPFRCKLCNNYSFKRPLETVNNSSVEKYKYAFNPFIAGQLSRIKNRKLFHKEVFICNVCQKPFTQRYNLKVHMRLHTGEKPFKCDICFQRFPFRPSWKRHVLSHK